MAPPAKKSKTTSTSSTDVTGGLKLLHEQTVTWTLQNFKDMMSNKSNNMLNSETLKFVVGELQSFPRTEWKVTMGVTMTELRQRRRELGYYDSDDDGSDSDSYFNICDDCRNSLGTIYISYQLKTPDLPYLEGLFMRMNVDVMRSEHYVARNLSETELSDASSAYPSSEKRLTVCKLDNWRDTLHIQRDGTLVFRLKFSFYQRNSRKPNHVTTKQLRDKLKNDTKEDFAKFLDNLDDDKLIVTAGDGKTFEAHKNILKARSPVFNTMLSKRWDESDSRQIKVDFPSAAVDWILKFARDGEVRDFVVKADEQEVKKDEQPDIKKENEEKKDKEDETKAILSDLIQIADMYDFRELKNYFDHVLPTLCVNDEKLAPYLSQLAAKFALKKAKGKLRKFIARRSHLLDSIIDEFFEG